jgi:hypothetical protein
MEIDGMTTNSQITVGAVVLDCPDPLALAGFYARLLGWAEPVVEHEGWVTLAGPGSGPTIDFQLATDYLPPTWPDPTRPQMLHLDLKVADLASAAQHAVAVGARPLDLSAEHPTFQVYADPAGHPFCLCAC